MATNPRGPASRSGLVAAVVLVAVVLGGVVLSQVGGGQSPDPGDGTGPPGNASPASRPPAGGVGSEAQRALAASRALLRLEDAVRSGREGLFDRVFADSAGAAEAGDDLFTSLRRLPLSTYSLSYITEVSRRGPTWRADVEAQWGLRGFDARAATSEIEVTFTDGANGAQVTAMEPADGQHAPAWLLGRLQADDVGRGLVLSLQPPLTGNIADQTRRAVRDVREVLDGWRGGLVVVLPETTAQLENLLNADPGSYDSIAAVTASADGSGDPSAPVRVVLNPPVFTGLGPIAGQVVLTHEATHAATGATFRDMPLWLVEGFADYVALVNEPVPLKVAAGQALVRVRREGPPRRLPTEGDFSTSAHGLGASYESAWLACRLIAQRYGEDGLLRFYREVARTGETNAAFRSVLGTDVAAFTAQWREHLRELAR
jgi:hypothetical protein